MNELGALSLLPFVPSGKDYDASRRLFGELGFEEVWENDGYAGFRNGDAQFILQKFDVKAFAENFTTTFFPMNLSAMPATLVESELFGHRRGAFTGAVQNRQGWLEVCPPLGTVFMDEIAETEPAIQVKLLRVLQARTFTRLGESQERHFRGKLIFKVR